MRKIFYSVCFTICMLLSLNSSVLAAELSPNLDAKEYYMYIIKEYQMQPIVANMSGVITTPFGNAQIDADFFGLSQNAKTFKAVLKMDLNVIGKEKTTKEMTYYYEQIKNKAVVYMYEDGKWSKKTTPVTNATNIYANNSITPEQAMEFVKSVEFISNTPEQAELKVVLDLEKVAQNVDKLFKKDLIDIKSQKEQEELIDLCKNITNKIKHIVIYYKVDKQNKSCTANVDFTKAIQGIVDVVIDSPALNFKQEDKQVVEKFINESSVTFTTNMKIVDKPEVVIIPKEAKKLAKEIKAIKNKSTTVTE